MDKTKKIIGRRLTAQHLEYQKIAENVEYKTISRDRLYRLASKLPMIDLISDSEAVILTNLLAIIPDKEFKKGGFPITLRTNQEISFGSLSPGRISTILSRLYDCGLIVIWDFGYYGRRNINDIDYYERYTATIRAIDLRIFIIRYYELKKKVDKKLKRIAY
ncbi:MULTISPECIES: helix-turn-helix domain-containing protein [unclassified Bartonella]|uniref:helix-turn-helix domain-containing protein n=1 Tax=unclassified Bartonella TaxID=2645622 RepID=UPI0035CEDBFF